MEAGLTPAATMASSTPARMNALPDPMLHTPLDAVRLPAGIRSRIVRGINGLDMHVLEAGFEPGEARFDAGLESGVETSRRPLLLLLHGFPELA